MSYSCTLRKWSVSAPFVENGSVRLRLQAHGYHALDHDGCIMPYLFTGTRGVGKTTTRGILASGLQL